MSRTASPISMNYKGRRLDEKHKGKIICGKYDRNGLIDVYGMGYRTGQNQRICGMPLKKRKNAEGSKQVKKDSCCCGATLSNPCVCMYEDVMECSASEPMCPCYQKLTKSADEEKEEGKKGHIPGIGNVRFIGVPSTPTKYDEEGRKIRLCMGCMRRKGFRVNPIRQMTERRIKADIEKGLSEEGDWEEVTFWCPGGKIMFPKEGEGEMTTPHEWKKWKKTAEREAKEDAERERRLFERYVKGSEDGLDEVDRYYIDPNNPYWKILPQVKALADIWDLDLIGFDPGWAFGLRNAHYTVQIPMPIMQNMLKTNITVQEYLARQKYGSKSNP